MLSLIAGKHCSRSSTHIGGLQKTGLGDTLTYRIETGEFVQIMNDSGTHWITVSKLDCLPNHFNVYDIEINVETLHQGLSNRSVLWSTLMLRR